MSAEQSALLVAIVAFIGVVTAPIITGFVSHDTARREKRHAYIQSLVNSLIEVRSELQFYQKTGWDLRNILVRLNRKFEDPTEAFGPESELAALMSSEEFRKMEIAYGRAYSIMISVDIPEIRAKAGEVLNEKNNMNPSLKLAAIDFALKTLGEQYEIFEKSGDWRDSK
jgi:hypothetical protein